MKPNTEKINMLMPLSSDKISEKHLRVDLMKKPSRICRDGFNATVIEKLF